MGLQLIHLQPERRTHQFIPPTRYGIVEIGVFRGGYPKEKNFEYLKRLKLRKIISLTPEPLNKTVAEFCDRDGIQMIHIRVEKAKDHVPLDKKTVTKALQILIRPENHPVYLHCLDGANVTGMVVMCLRKLQLWSSQISMAEFCRYTRDGVVSTEESEFLEKFGAHSMITLSASISLLVKDTVPSSLNMDDIRLSVDDSANVHHANELEVNALIPPWLWNGKVPASFLRNLTGTSFTPSNPPVVASHLTYGHPFIKVKLSEQHLKALLCDPAHLSLVLNMFPNITSQNGRGYFSPASCTRAPSFSRQAMSPVEPSPVVIEKELPPMNTPVQTTQDKTNSTASRKLTKASSEVDASLTLKALALEGIEKNNK